LDCKTSRVCENPEGLTELAAFQDSTDLPERKQRISLLRLFRTGGANVLGGEPTHMPK
jgi:hypothetical protein